MIAFTTNYGCNCTATYCTCNSYYNSPVVYSTNYYRREPVLPSWFLPGMHKSWGIWCAIKRALPCFVAVISRVFEPLHPPRLKRVRARRHGVNHSPRRRRA